MNRRTLSSPWFAIVGLVAFGLLLFYGGRCFLTHHGLTPLAYSAAFDEKGWKSASDLRSNTRWLMAKDLADYHLRPGMTAARVKELLGPPTYVGDRAYVTMMFPRSSANRVFEYNLGSWSGFRVDSDFLVVFLDSTGKVQDAARLQY